MYQFQVDGMGCISCVSKITRAIQAHDPDATVRIELDSGRVSVVSEAPADLVCGLLAALGYPARLAS